MMSPSGFIYCFGFWILLPPIYSLKCRFNLLQRRECDLVTKNNHVLFSICLSKNIWALWVRAINYYPFRLLIGFVFGFVKIVASRSGRSEQLPRTADVYV